MFRCENVTFRIFREGISLWKKNSDDFIPGHTVNCTLYMMLLDLNLVFHFIKHGVTCAMKRPTSNPTFNWHECLLLQIEREKHFVHTLFRLFQVASVETGRVNEDKTYRISMKAHSYEEESNCKCWMPLVHLPKTCVSNWWFNCFKVGCNYRWMYSYSDSRRGGQPCDQWLPMSSPLFYRRAGFNRMKWFQESGWSFSNRVLIKGSQNWRELQIDCWLWWCVGVNVCIQIQLQLSEA